MKRVKAKLQEFPFIHGVSLALMGNAVDLLIKVGPNPIGNFTVGFLAISALLGGVLTILGLQWRGSVIIANGIERAGHIIMMGAWALDAYLIYGHVHFGIIVPIALGAASVVRIYMLGRRNRQIVDTVTTLGEEKRGL